MQEDLQPEDLKTDGHPDGVSFSISSLEFSGGKTISLNEGDLLIVVGPNNCGKSSSLRGIREGLGGRNARMGPVVQQIQIGKNADAKSLTSWFEEHTECSDRANYRWLNATIAIDQVANFWEQRQHQAIFASFFVTLADTASRLSIVQPQNAVGVGQPPSHPFHVLFDDFDRDKRLSEYFRRAFGEDLILQRAGQQCRLHCCDRAKDGDGVNSTVFDLIKKVRLLPALDEQGDGMRSFVGSLLYLLTSPGFVHLVDEPDAFLHPPQARELGKIFGELQSEKSKRQIIVSTHSGDFLRGVIESSPKRLKIARLTRRTLEEKDVNDVRLLEVEELEALWGDPVLRFSQALDAIFHEAVVICEYEADCQFYSAVSEAMGLSKSGPDTMYLGSGGKGGMAKLAKALAALGVPTALIVDFDVLNDSNPLKELVKLCGGNWLDFEQDWKQLKQDIEAKKKPLTKNQVADKISDFINNESTNFVSRETSDGIRNALKSVSPWEEPKRLGLDYLDGQMLTKANALLARLAACGICVVPVGELEGFVRELRAGNTKGSKWVAKVLREVPQLESDARVSKARKFIKGVVDYLDEQGR